MSLFTLGLPASTLLAQSLRWIGEKHGQESRSPDTIRTYYKGCNTGDVALMKSTFTPDVIHYFSAHGPIKGADNLALYWQGFNTAELQTTWTVDHGITDGDETVVEWSMISTFGDGRPQEMLRGTEWYRFSEGKIAEIRAY